MVNATGIRHHQHGYTRNGRFMPGCFQRQPAPALTHEERAARRRESLRNSNARSNPRSVSTNPGVAMLRTQRNQDQGVINGQRNQEIDTAGEMAPAPIQEPIAHLPDAGVNPPLNIDLLGESSAPSSESSSSDEESAYEGDVDVPAGHTGTTLVMELSAEDEALENECFCMEALQVCY
jgi:hypothetical protein